MMKSVFFSSTPKELYILPGFALLIPLLSLLKGDWAGVINGLVLLVLTMLLVLWLRNTGISVDDEGITRRDGIRKCRIRWIDIERIKLSYCRVHLAGFDDKGRRRQFLVEICAGKLRDKADFEKVDLLKRYLSPYFSFDREAVLERKQPSPDLVPVGITEKRTYWRIYSYGLIALWLAGATWLLMHLPDFEDERAMRKILFLSPFAAAFAVALPQALWRRGQEDRLARVYGYERLGWQMRKRDGGGDDSREIPRLARGENGG